MRKETCRTACATKACFAWPQSQIREPLRSSLCKTRPFTKHVAQRTIFCPAVAVALLHQYFENNSHTTPLVENLPRPASAVPYSSHSKQPHVHGWCACQATGERAVVLSHSLGLSSDRIGACTVESEVCIIFVFICRMSHHARLFQQLCE